MAVSAFTKSIPGPDCIKVAWLAVPNGNTGQPVSLPGYFLESVHINGTFGAGGSVSLKGSNDATEYLVLTDPQANALTKTAAAIEAVLENCIHFRPEVTAGDGTTAININAYFSRRVKPS